MLSEWNSTHDVTSVTALETLSSLTPPTYRCYGGKVTAHLKAIAHVSQNLLCVEARIMRSSSSLDVLGRSGDF
jgi:hypothetical protein